MPSATASSPGGALWDIVLPQHESRVPGVAMAGFRARGDDLVDIRVVPYPAATVAFDLTGGLVVVNDVDGPEVAGSVAAGLAPGGARGVGHHIECLQLRLSPVVSHAVLGDSANLAGAVVPLDEVWGPDAAQFVDRLRAAGTWRDRFSMVKDEVVSRLEQRAPVDPEVAFAWRRMVGTHGQVRIEQLAADVEWSRKRLWSRFRAQVGVTPKRAARLIRFDHAAHRLAAGLGPARVAAETGYTDESHLHRDARDFIDLTPTAIASAPWLSVDEVAWANGT